VCLEGRGRGRGGEGTSSLVQRLRSEDSKRVPSGGEKPRDAACTVIDILDHTHVLSLSLSFSLSFS